QFVINSPRIEPIVQSGGKVSMTEKSGELVVTGRKDIFTINLASGALTSWRSNGVELLKGDLEPYFWKPPNDNQKQNGYVNRLGLWKNAPQERKVKQVKKSTQGGLAVIEMDMSLAIGAFYQLRYSVNGEGQLQVEASYQPEKDSLPLMPKFGMR